MINLTSQYPNAVFLAPAISTLATQYATIATSGILNKNFPKKIRRTNVGVAPDGSGVQMSQIDVAIGAAPYMFPNLQTAQVYAQQGANEMVNNANFYVENINIPYGTYSLLVWGPA